MQRVPYFNTIVHKMHIVLTSSELTTNFQSKSQSKLFGISVFNKICIKPTLFVHILIKSLVTNSMLLNYNSFNRINSKRRDQNNVSIFVIIFFFILWAQCFIWFDCIESEFNDWIKSLVITDQYLAIKITQMKN